MSLIYEPKGRAREYAALALNIYSGCDHRCSYCYAPSALRKQRANFVQSRERKDFLPKLRKELAKTDVRGEQVHLCFACDAYQSLDVELQHTRYAIDALHNAGASVCVLTKGGARAMRDLDLFTAQDVFATTLTCLADKSSAEWEPGAALPGDRIATIEAFHNAGVPTWVSLEPVLDPAVALQIIRETRAFVDVFKVGRLNYHPLAKEINWPKFAVDASALLERLGYQRNGDADAIRYASAGNRQYYVKHDLAGYLPQAQKIEPKAKPIAWGQMAMI